MKKDKSGIKGKGKLPWKSVPIDHTAISPGALEGLVGIEELSDYQLTKSSDVGGRIITAKTVNKKMEKISAKRKVEDATPDVQPKKKRKEKAKSEFVVTDSVLTEELEQSAPKKAKKTKKRSKTRGHKKLENPEPASDAVTTEPSCDKESSKDSENKLHSIMSAWSSLFVPEPILKALCELGFKEPTQIQLLSMPPAIKGRKDVMGAAETGSGKTLAFGIPILAGIMNAKKYYKPFTEEDEDVSAEKSCDEDEHSTDEDVGNKEEMEEGDGTEDVESDNILWALILAPTRELAVQIYEHLLAVGKYTGIKMAVLVGGMSQQKQERMLRRCPEVVIATPGRLWELIKDGNAHLSTVDQIRFLAVDETDRMLEAGHFQELKDLLLRINQGGAKHRRQNFMFSATLSLVHDAPRRKKFKRKQTPGQKLHSLGQLIGLKDPKIVDVTPEGATATGLIETRLMSSSLLDRDIRLVSVLESLAHYPLSNTGSSSKTIVFCNSVGGVRRLNGILSALKLSPVTLHSGMQQKQRLRSLEKFSKGGILLATDVAARGLDLPQVDHVIHFQVPHASETYVHRSGRTARGKREGLSVLLVEPKEVPFYSRLCKTLGKDSGLPFFPLDEHVVAKVKERVRVARDIDFLEHQARRSGAEEGWMQKTAEEADIVLDEDYVSKKHIVNKHCLKKDIEVKKKELNSMLKRTLIPT